MNGRVTKAGFTIVELLVVIVLIGVLLSLVFPAVMSVRESMRRLTCANNQRNLSTALLAFETRRGHFPGYINRIGGNPASWVVAVLPEIEQTNVYETFVAGAPQPVALPMVICPNDSPADHPPSEHLSYAVNCGLTDGVAGAFPTETVPSDWAPNGVFHEHLLEGVARTHVSRGYVSTHDGTSHTLLLSENVAADTWPGTDWLMGNDLPFSPGGNKGEYEGGLLWTRILPDEVPRHSYVNGLEDERANLRTSARAAQQGQLLGLAPPGRDFARPSSRHPGGVHMTFVDGHVRFISDRTPFLLYALMMSTHGAAVRQPGDQHAPPQHPLNSIYTETEFDSSQM